MEIQILIIKKIFFVSFAIKISNKYFSRGKRHEQMYAMHARRNEKGSKLGFFQQTTILDKLVHKRKYNSILMIDII